MLIFCKMLYYVSCVTISCFMSEHSIPKCIEASKLLVVI